MKRGGLSLFFLVTLTGAAPPQRSTLVHANFDDLQPGTRLQNTPYASLTFSGLTVKDKGPRAIFPDTEPNYALQYYDPRRRAPLITIAGTAASSFDFGGVAAGCLWDTTRTGAAVAASQNSTTPPSLSPATADDTIPPTPIGKSLLNGTSPDRMYYPCVACAIEIACQGQSVVARQSLTWRPSASWSSNIMARWLGFGAGFRGVSWCDVGVMGGAVNVDEIILVLDSLQYRVNSGQPQRQAVDVA